MFQRLCLYPQPAIDSMRIEAKSLKEVPEKFKRVKVGVVAGTVYYTAEEGIWKDSSHTDEVYANLYKTVAPYIKEIPVEVPEIPSMGEISYQARRYWNKGVIASCMFLSELPHKSVDWTKQGYAFIVKQFNEPTTKKQIQ